MTVTRITRHLFAAFIAVFYGVSVPLAVASHPSSSAAVGVQETFAQAKALYAAASYDEALALLEKLTPSTSDDAISMAEYRVFCLLALGRTADANRAIESIVREQPFYKPSETQASPRVQAVIRDVRRQLLPGIIQAAYADAKVAFERKDPGTTAQFDRVIALLDDPDAKGVASLNDLRTVVVGFRDLSKALAAPPPPAAQPVVAAPPPSAAPPVAAAPTPAPAPAKAAYDSSDTDVVAPIVINQRLPPWLPNASNARQRFTGQLYVLIDERGSVATAEILKSAHPTYDASLLQATKTWRYNPATRGGVPVPYTKLIDINLGPPR